MDACDGYDIKEQDYKGVDKGGGGAKAPPCLRPWNLCTSVIKISEVVNNQL